MRKATAAMALLLAACAMDTIDDSRGASVTGSGSVMPSPECMDDCDCEDANPCTSDICEAGSCVRSNTKRDGASCGELVGTCRGGWCCNGDTACFEPHVTAIEEMCNGGCSGIVNDGVCEWHGCGSKNDPPCIGVCVGSICMSDR
jgi:hypothetical protein